MLTSITPERKREIDEVLKETHKKFMNGEIKARPIKEFWEERKRKNEELKNGCDKGDDIVAEVEKYDYRKM